MDDLKARNVLTTARKGRQMEGLFEAEICCGSEVDLHRHLETCEKNPGHKKFIPAGDFQGHHLPERYRDNDILNLVRALSDITVRIATRYTSHKRPSTYPDSDRPYPSADCKGSNKIRTGSGWVWRVNVFSMLEYNKKTCPCHACRGSLTPQKRWAVIDIYTVMHLVYDNDEAAQTTCHFFYESNESSLNELPSLSGACIGEASPDGDACMLTFITHDIDLGHKLCDKWKLYKALHVKVGEKYNTNDNDGQLADARDEHKLTIIVSHPHGCSKQISVGYFTSREEMEYNDVLTRYTYTTATCPGCSGAPVYVLSRWWWWGCDHPHSGQCDENKNLNYSGVAMY